MRKNDLIERIFWLIRLRWIAVIGVISTVYFTNKILNISLYILPLYIVPLFLAGYNLLFYFILIFRKKKFIGYLFANRIANIQISLDLLSLAVLIHFSGGIENPFIFYFIFHMIIASILLSRKASFLQATFSVFLFSSMIIFEFFGILPHYCLKGFIPSDLHNNLLYIGGVTFVFISTLYIAVYMATSISNRLRERERSLKEANELLMEKDRIKSEYVLRVTHDIKEHLSAIQSCIEPVTTNITGPLNDKQSDLLKRAIQRTEKLMFFVKALLEITRIKLSKEMKIEYFSLPLVTKNAVSNIEEKAKKKEIDIKLFIDSQVDQIKGAQTYIEEALTNLLANSVKYTFPEGKININVRDKGDSVLIQIKDTGIGIPKDELPNIFEEFYRASNARKVERDGTGLGVPIAKQIIERHNGKIWVESELGKGSSFFIILPK